VHKLAHGPQRDEAIEQAAQATVADAGYVLPRGNGVVIMRRIDHLARLFGAQLFADQHQCLRAAREVAEQIAGAQRRQRIGEYGI
jgi:hypothetical protein